MFYMGSRSALVRVCSDATPGSGVQVTNPGSSILSQAAASYKVRTVAMCI